MSVVLNQNNTWAVARWVSEAFFEDCLRIINCESRFLPLKSPIIFAINAYTFTLDFSDVVMQANVGLLKEILEQILKEYNEIHQSSKADEIYIQKLKDLNELLVKEPTFNEKRL